MFVNKHLRRLLEKDAKCFQIKDINNQPDFEAASIRTYLSELIVLHKKMHFRARQPPNLVQMLRLLNQFTVREKSLKKGKVNLATYANISLSYQSPAHELVIANNNNTYNI